MRILAGWIRTGASGTVVGVAGSGKSNFLGFLCHRPDALAQYLPADSVPAALIPIDLNNLPANDPGTLYRVILRAFHESRQRLDAQLQTAVSQLYLENRAEKDPFLTHSALRELLYAFRERSVQTVLVLDGFDRFLESAEPEMTGTLRGLRDSFKDMLSYIVGMRQEVIFLADPAVLGKLYELLDTHVCWIGPMEKDDAGQLIADETRTGATQSAASDVHRLLQLTGGHPGLLKAACHWWLAAPVRPTIDLWERSLLATPTILYRLREIWSSLTLAEQQQLFEMHGQGGTTTAADTLSPLLQPGSQFDEQREWIARSLRRKRMVEPAESGERIAASLLAAYIDQLETPSPGGIWLERETDTLYQGDKLLANLSPLERSLLQFLIEHPRARHSHTALIDAVWPADISRAGVSNEALYQLVRGLRLKIEPDPSRPNYVVNWRGWPEGGYQFFPEGRPN